MTAEPGASEAAGCRLLAWDSDFFGRRIARVEPAAIAGEAGGAAAAWLRENQVDCVHLLADASDQATIDAAAALGFRLVDVRVTLAASGALPVPPSRPAPPVRAVQPDDIAGLMTIARQSHRDTRFYVDGRFDRERCDELYAVWIERSCRGWAEQVFVAEAADRLGGYLTCHLRQTEAQIGLIAVDAAQRGKGSGMAMIAEARRWAAGHGRTTMSVATQGRNVAALGFYQHAGFTIRAMEIWFHKWLMA